MTNGFVLATDPMLPPHGLEGAVYAIGNFDGLHLGHQAVIGRAVAIAKARAAPSALLTFEPHPADFFAGRPVVFRLTPARNQAAICARLGLTGLVLIRFDASLAGMSADEFITKIQIQVTPGALTSTDSSSLWLEKSRSPRINALTTSPTLIRSAGRARL